MTAGGRSTNVDGIMRTQRIMWAAQLAASVVFLVVLVVQQRSGTLPTDPPFVMLPAFGVVSLGLLVASFLVPRLMYRAALVRTELKVEEVADDEPQLFRTAPKTIRLLADPDAALLRATQLFLTPFVLGIALAEAVAVFGLVLGLMGFGLPQVAPFFLGGWIAIGSHFPAQARIIRALEAATGARLRQPTEPS